MTEIIIPERLTYLHLEEELLREKAKSIIDADPRYVLHLNIVEHSMDLVDMLRQFPTDDEDMKVIKVLGLRLFNAFGASVKLALSGYSQNCALLMRDILETVFLISLFEGDRAAISRWRHADKKEYRKHFSPVRVREALDKRDGFSGKKRAEMYELFSELAGHPTMKSHLMLRPEKGGDAVIGPFIERTTLDAALSEMGRLAVQAGELLGAFIPANWHEADASRAAFAEQKGYWVSEFYSHLKSK
jgi:hypothetical protein